MRKRLSIVTVLLPVMITLSFVSCAMKVEEGGGSSGYSKTEEEPLPEPVILSYIALGDSVPRGYGLENPGEQNYAALFSKQMNENENANVLHNLAKDGINTSDLLSFLHSTEAAIRLKDADLVTLNIGGNNILMPILRILHLMQNFDYKLLQNANFNLLREFEAGVDDFANDFPQIITRMRQLAPNAKIIVSTIYNPVPSSVFYFYDLSETHILNMNQIIMNGQGDYAVADTYAAFHSAQEPVTYVNLDPRLGSISVDVHPNAAGHELMSEIHYAVWMDSLSPANIP